jgi:hypothetical protein
MNAPFATGLAGWKASVKNRLGWTLVPNAADVDSAESMRIAAGVLDVLGVSRGVASAVPKDPDAIAACRRPCKLGCTRARVANGHHL